MGFYRKMGDVHFYLSDVVWKAPTRPDLIRSEHSVSIFMKFVLFVEVMKKFGIDSNLCV